MGWGGSLHLLDDCVPVLEVGGARAPPHCCCRRRRMSVCLSVCLCVCVISLWRDRAGGVSRPSPGPCRNCIGLASGWGCLHCPPCPRCLPPPRPLPPQRRSPESDLPPRRQRAPPPLLPPRLQSRFQICQTGSCCCGRASGRLLQECLQTRSRGQHFFFFCSQNKDAKQQRNVKKESEWNLRFKRKGVEIDSYIYQQQDTLVCYCALFPCPSLCHLWWVARNRPLGTQSPRCLRLSLSVSLRATWNTHGELESAPRAKDLSPELEQRHEVTSRGWTEGWICKLFSCSCR